MAGALQLVESGTLKEEQKAFLDFFDTFVAEESLTQLL